VAYYNRLIKHIKRRKNNMQDNLFNDEWRTDYIPSGLAPHLTCVLRSNTQKDTETGKKGLKWVVIDNFNGITYETPAKKTESYYYENTKSYGGDLFANVLPNHNKMYGDRDAFIKLSSFTRYDFRIPKRYYYSTHVSNKALIFRMYSYQPIPIDRKQGLFEFLRIYIHEDEAWVETRDGKKTELTPSMVFGKNSMIRRANEIPDNDTFFYSSVIYDEDGEENWKLLDDMFSFKNAGEFFKGCQFNPSPFGMSIMYFRSKSKQRFYKDVPEEIKEYLAAYGSGLVTSNAEECIKNAPSQYLSIVRNDGSNGNYGMAVIGSKKIWYFRYNNVTEKWSSASDKRTKSIIAGVGGDENICNREFKPDIFHDTMYDGVLCNMSDEESSYIEKAAKYYGIINIANYSRKFVSVEQAAKLGRGDLLYMAIEHAWRNIYLEDEYIKSLPEIFGITGKQLKLIPKISSEKLYGITYSNICNILTISQLPIETKLGLSGCSSDRVTAAVQKFVDDDVNPLPFFRAVLKYPMQKQEQMLMEFLDYRGMLSNLRTNYANVENHFPDFPKPSQIKEMHDRINQLMVALRKKKEKETWEQENKLIAIQKETDAEMEYSDGTYSLILPKDGDDIRSEGVTLCHCVGGYTDIVANGTTHILFLRKNEDMDKRLFTMEVRNNKIRQLYGYHDSYNKDESIKKFVETYAQRMKYEINCNIG
jgi:hypothetical protein